MLTMLQLGQSVLSHQHIKYITVATYLASVKINSGRVWFVLSLQYVCLCNCIKAYLVHLCKLELNLNAFSFGLRQFPCPHHFFFLIVSHFQTYWSLSNFCGLYWYYLYNLIKPFFFPFYVATIKAAKLTVRTHNTERERALCSKQNWFCFLTETGVTCDNMERQDS